MAPSLGVEISPINMRRDAGEIERAIAASARTPNGGLILTASGMSSSSSRSDRRARRVGPKLPAVYSQRFFVAAQQVLISYGPDRTDQFRKAAGYVDRILKGEKPGDIQVQAPTKYELADRSQDRQGAWSYRAAVGLCHRQ